MPVEHALIGDADLTLEALIAEVRDRLKGKPRGRAAAVAAEIAAVRDGVAGAVDAQAHLATTRRCRPTA